MASVTLRGNTQYKSVIALLDGIIISNVTNPIIYALLWSCFMVNTI